MLKILIVEDDTNINNLLYETLLKGGYCCEQAFSGTEAKMLLEMQAKNYQLVLLDLMLPGLSGEELLIRIRQKWSLPVIVLTAKGELDEKVQVLTSGADDYITKPFEIREVIARIQVQLRRFADHEVAKHEKNILLTQELMLDRETLEVSIAGEMLAKAGIVFLYI